MSVFDLIVIMDEGKGLDEFTRWYEEHPNDVIDLLCRFTKDINKHFDFEVELPPKSDEARRFHKSTWTSSVIHCQIPLWFKKLFSVLPEIKEMLIFNEGCKLLLDNYWFQSGAC